MQSQIAKRLGQAVAGLSIVGRSNGRRKASSRAQIQMVLGETPNENWAETNRGSRMTFVRAPLIKKTDTVFTMGSCFAREISYALRDLGFRLFPKYNEIAFDKTTQKPYKLALRNHMNHYNTFTIRYEFEHAFGNSHYDIKDFIRPPEKYSSDRRSWQDPYRRQIYAVSDTALLDLSHKIDGAIRQGVLEADVYVITLGLTEVWRNNVNGLVLNQAPHGIEEGEGIEGFSFLQSSYEENYENMRWVCAEIFRQFPQRKVIITVSPVALKRTFSNLDVIVANTESKSILRAVAGALSREFPNVVYWPSYEIALAQDIYEDDGRHVTPEAVKRIVDQFAAVHLSS
jgi:hypothetical protein